MRSSSKLWRPVPEVRPSLLADKPSPPPALRRLAAPSQRPSPVGSGLAGFRVDPGVATLHFIVASYLFLFFYRHLLPLFFSLFFITTRASFRLLFSLSLNLCKSEAARAACPWPRCGAVPARAVSSPSARRQLAVCSPSARGALAVHRSRAQTG